MVLVASIGLSLAVLGLSLIIQSRILLDSPDKLPLLAKRLRVCAYAIAIPIGIVLTVIGFIWPRIADSYISVGVILIVLAITLLIQSQILSVPDASLRQLGQRTRIWAYICAGVGLVAVVITLVRVLFFT